MTNSDKYDLRVIDFGFATAFSGAPLKECVGTPCYMAPEVILCNYGKASDLWSLGVVMYGLLSGMLPFPDLETTEETHRNILNCRYAMRGPEWDSVSATAKNLVSRLLTYDANKRITAGEALHHSFFTEL